MNHIGSMAQPFGPCHFQGNTLPPTVWAKKSGPSTALRAASSTFQLEAVC
jgi:hypothetical protein